MSRLSGIKLLEVDGKVSTYSFKAIDRRLFLRMPYKFHTVKKNDILQHMAHDEYDGHDEHWWIIALANGLLWPTDIYIGQVLIIPLDYKSVISAIETFNKM